MQPLLDAAGKLNILGSFDKLYSKEEPITHHQCALAIRIRFERLEEGQKRIRIAFVNSDGGSVMPTVEAPTNVQFQPNESTRTASTRGYQCFSN